jgi:peptidoglycan/xylan/chitin deacetylase (PgdA/CDA1 family)
MKTILLTIDTEFYISEAEILGIDGSHGLDDILQILDEYDVKATFFVDYFSIKKWGEAIFSLIHEKIIDHQHEIQLHLHPYISGGRNYLWQYSKKEQERYINEAVEYFQKFNSCSPEFFRAGGYSADEKTIGILEKKGFLADLSFQYQQKRCKIPGSVFPYINKINYINSLLEIPTTVYKYYYPWIRYNSVNLEWCSLSELKCILNSLTESPLNHLVVMMHSFGLMNRKDRKIVKKSDYRKNKFIKFIKYAIRHNYRFETVGTFYKSLTEQKIRLSKDFIPVIKNPITVTSGLMVKFINYWLLNKKLRHYIYLFGIVFFFPLFILLYLVFFNYIEPSVQEYKDVKPDIHAWNSDNDIHSIEYDYIYIKTTPILNRVKRDSEGIIFRDVFSDLSKYQVEKNADTLFIPTDMSQAIISLFNDYQVSPQKSYLDEIELFADWLNHHAVIRDSIAVWTHPYGFTKYGLKPGWTGAWAMGSVLSALARYYQISGDPLILDLGEMAVKAFTTKIEHGGILAIDENADYWYEEYPAIPRNSVLNGHINGILGLYDFWRVSNLPLALTLVNRGIHTVLHNIERYDTGYWSYYDLRYSYVTDYYYHTIVHIPQLNVLYQISGDILFKKYSEKWHNYLNEPFFSFFKLKILIDVIHRRFSYKSFFTWGKSSG